MRNDFVATQEDALPTVESQTGELLVVADKLDFTDAGNGKLFALKNKGKYIYDRAKKDLGWYHWSGQRWNQDTKGGVYQAAEAAIRALPTMMFSPDGQLTGAMYSHVGASLSEKKLRSMLALAGIQPGIAVNQGELDADNHLFNVTNGTIDLRTISLLPHNPAHLITKIGGCEYIPGASCFAFENFLNETFAGDSEMIDFVARLMGLCLSGESPEQIVMFFYGTGANGKSVLVEGISRVMGDYLTRARKETFMYDKNRAGAGHSEDVAALCGRRLVVSSEIAENDRLDETLVKDASGGDMLSASYKYGHVFTFRATYKLLLVGNHRPVITDTTHSIWRRMILVPFTVTVPKERQEKSVDAMVRRFNLPGVLNWMIAGLKQYRSIGLSIPEKVSRAVEEYQEDSDIVGRFMDECCSVEAQCTAPVKIVYERFCTWAKANGHKEICSRTLSSRIVERGFPRSIRMGTPQEYRWKGFGLTGQ